MNNLLIALCLITQLSFGQSKIIQLPNGNFWHSRVKELAMAFNLKDLTTTKEPFHFRFWTQTQVVDISTTNLTTFQGKLIYYTIEAQEGRKERDTVERVHSHLVIIDTAIAMNIYQYVTQQKLFFIPTQDSIEGWDDVLDGTSYFVEYATPSFYSFKNYCSPEVYPFSEANVIVNVLHFLIQTLNIDNEWSTYVRSLPKGCYLGNSIELRCNK